jgi:hypothetical protein
VVRRIEFGIFTVKKLRDFERMIGGIQVTTKAMGRRDHYMSHMIPGP